MNEPRFTIKAYPSNEPLGGDDVLDDALKHQAAIMDAIIVDNNTGQVVYDSETSSDLSPDSLG